MLIGKTANWLLGSVVVKRPISLSDPSVFVAFLWDSFLTYLITDGPVKNAQLFLAMCHMQMRRVWLFYCRVLFYVRQLSVSSRKSTDR